MPRYHLDFDKDKTPKPGTYFCTGTFKGKPCNHKQVIGPGQVLVPCPKCGGRSFTTV